MDTWIAFTVPSGSSVQRKKFCAVTWICVSKINLVTTIQRENMYYNIYLFFLFFFFFFQDVRSRYSLSVGGWIFPDENLLFFYDDHWGHIFFLCLDCSSWSESWSPQKKKIYLLQFQLSYPSIPCVQCLRSGWMRKQKSIPLNVMVIPGIGLIHEN
jgi:hypothetical protein